MLEKLPASVSLAVAGQSVAVGVFQDEVVFIFGYQERERSKYHLRFRVAVTPSSCANEPLRAPFKLLLNSEEESWLHSFKT